MSRHSGVILSTPEEWRPHGGDGGGSFCCSHRTVCFSGTFYSASSGSGWRWRLRRRGWRPPPPPRRDRDRLFGHLLARPTSSTRWKSSNRKRRDTRSNILFVGRSARGPGRPWPSPPGRVHESRVGKCRWRRIQRGTPLRRGRTERTGPIVCWCPCKSWSRWTTTDWTSRWRPCASTALIWDKKSTVLRIIQQVYDNDRAVT